MLILTLLACASWAYGQAAQQPLSKPPFAEIDNSTAPFIFNSLASLLVQWPNTYHPNGHTIIPGILEPFTLLYHARKDANLPPSPEWFAFDPEMSYGIMSGRGGQTFLLTYRNIRPARIVYFDGMSAALSQTGWLDSQEVLIKNRSDDHPSGPSQPYDEYRRARQLCSWGKELGIEGFIRMNSGFELMWCDFESPTIQLVSHLNITTPGTPPTSTSPAPRAPLAAWPSGSPLPEPPTRGRGGGGGRRGGGGMSPLAFTAFSEWLRAAAQRGTVPQQHIILDYASFVTFYHPRLQSLDAARQGQKMRQHRSLNISDTDAQSVIDELEEALQRPPWRRAGSGMNWNNLARDVVEEWAGRVVQLHEYLNNASATLDEGAPVNTTETLAAVRRLTYSPLNPFMDTRASTNSSASDWVFATDLDLSGESFRPPRRFPPPLPPPSRNMNTSALQRCVYSATGFLNDPRVHKTPQEVLLQTSVETVRRRLCTDYSTTFVESMDADDHLSGEDVRKMLSQWEVRITNLMEWLDWVEWMRCDEVCPWDSVCTMPMWPVVFFGGGPRRGPGEQRPETPEDWKPRCISLVPETRNWLDVTSVGDESSKARGMDG